MNASSETWQLGSQAVQVSHLDKIYWPQVKFTKGDMLDYYRQIAPVMLPYFKDRPVTLRVYLQDAPGKSYYLRDCPDSAPDWLRRVEYHPKTVTHPVPLPLIDTAAGLIWFANEGAIEFHLWGSRVPDLTQADQAIFDLDPGHTASFDDVREAALQEGERSNRAHIARWVARGRLTEADAATAFGRLRWTTRLEDAAANADFVIEAVIERLEDKPVRF